MQEANDVRLSVRFDPREGRAGELAAALEVLAVASRRDAGCLRYDLYRGEGGSVLLWERWADRASLDSHLEQPHVAAFRAGAEALLAGPPTHEQWSALNLNEPQTEES